MAEAIAIIGLGASILTFIDFGIKLVRSIPQPRAPDSQEQEELNLAVQEIRIRRQQIQQAFPGHHQHDNGSNPLSEAEQQILELAITCDRIAADLIKAQQHRRPSTASNLRQLVLKGTLPKRTGNSGGSATLLSRLITAQTSLKEHINDALQRERDSAILTQLRALSSMQQDLAISQTPELHGLWDDILRLTTSTQTVTTHHDQSEMGGLTEKLQLFTEEYKTCRHTYQIIRSLAFVEIRRRFYLIPQAESRTNYWLLDRSKTEFLDWLESGTGIFWITGKAGSGKSTLMKFASEHRKTEYALQRWASRAKLHRASYYFWNQGSDLQKSLEGLLRTLLCQIFRRTPEIVSSVCPQAPSIWSLEDLKKTVQRVVSLDNIRERFCFFIDGLDEYHGDEEDIARILSFLSHHRNIKLCVSSRPRPVLDESFDGIRRTLTISDYTKDDMKNYVFHKLQPNEKFQKLCASGSACDELISEIADIANGVWLWVFLVTRDLVRAINRNEGITTLRKILDHFPKDLEAYFKFIIDGVHPIHKDDMARIFLITVEEVQPLPVFVFSLLEREKADPFYAINAPISPFPHQTSDELKVQRDRLHNRCKDLLVVGDGPHPVFLDHPVDFLHRTVRDYLRDCYYEELKSQLKSDFDPLVSLGSMMLFLLKGLPPIDVRESSSITRLIQIVDELLYYAHEAEKRGSTVSPLGHLLDEMDKVNTTLTANSMRNHWTHLRDMPQARGLDDYREGGHYNFLALTVQARLTKYVKSHLDVDLSLLKSKSGRPLLDYALRPRRTTPITMPYHSTRDECGIDTDMVQMLLEKGADPNQQVHLNEGRTVWALFLLSCYESNNRYEATPLLKDVWFRVCKLMIRYHAGSSCWFDNNKTFPLTVDSILMDLFGREQATELVRLMEEARLERKSTRSWLSRILPF